MNASGRVLCLLAAAIGASGAVLPVGPGKRYAKPCAAIAAARAGDIIQIDAAGVYQGDVCAWTQDRLTLRGVNGRPHLEAAGQAAQQKGIWVIQGKDTVVENLEFSGAAVATRNGSGIRLDGTGIIIRNCYFHNNEDGILTANRGGEVLIEFSEFGFNGSGDGYSHNIYIGRIDKFTLRYSYSHNARVGHLVKSRAAENYILYNRLSDEAEGTGSYQLDLPNGGLSYVIGNILQKGPLAQNRNVLSYMQEGMDQRKLSTQLFAVNNTFVTNAAKPLSYIVHPASLATPPVIENNVFSGGGVLPKGMSKSNVSAPKSTFMDAARYDYRLQAGSPAIDAGLELPDGAYPLAALLAYRHPACVQGRAAVGRIDAGAHEQGNAAGPLPAGVAESLPGRCR